MSNEPYFLLAAESLAESFNEKQTIIGKLRGLAGNGVGVVDFPALALHVYVRLQGDPSRLVPALNPGFVLTDGRPVDVWKKQDANRVTRYEIAGYNYDVQYAGDVFPGNIQSHAPSHMLDSMAGHGFDPVMVYPAMLTMLRVSAQATPDLTVHVNAGYYIVNGQLLYLDDSDSIAFTPPGAGTRYDLLGVDDTGALQIAVGGLAMPSGVFTLPDNFVPLAAVLLTTGQTEITDDDIFDVRAFLSMGGSGGSGATHWEPVTNGDPDFPEIVFSNGDVVMMEVA